MAEAVHGAVRSIHPPAAWNWLHTFMAVTNLIVVFGLLFFPLEMALFFSMELLDASNALYVRAGVGGFAVWVALVVRGQPWFYSATCMGIAAFCSGQIARAAYIPGGLGVPVSTGFVYIASMIFLLALSFRPNVYERLEDTTEKVADLMRENSLLKDELQRVGRQAKHFESAFYAEQDAISGRWTNRELP